MGEESACLPMSVVSEYRPYAVELRSLIRVKMADTEDLKQAKAVTDLLKAFCDKVHATATKKGLSAVSLLLHYASHDSCV